MSSWCQHTFVSVETPNIDKRKNMHAIPDILFWNALFDDRSMHRILWIKMSNSLLSLFTGPLLSTEILSLLIMYSFSHWLTYSFIQHTHLREMYLLYELALVSSLNYLWIHKGTRLNILLRILIWYRLRSKYCYSDSRKPWAVMKGGGLAL
jgi:hypothetical protein